MARTGISYRDVAEAATQLQAAGKNPTVDAVRAVLGTGSKGTLAPLLKQWKSKHADAIHEEATGLPAELVVAVKGLYQALQQEAQAKIEATEAQARQQVESAQQLAREAAQRAQELDAALQALREEHARVIHEREILGTALDESRHANAALQLRVEGLNQRIQDKGQELQGLSRQLALAQQNLEHYRESVSAQREQERADFELQRRTLELSLKAAREEIQALRATLQGLESERTLAHGEQERLRAALGTLSEQRDTLAESAREAQRQLAELQGLHQGLSRSFQETTAKLHTLSQQAIGLERQAAVDQERIRSQEDALAKAGDTLESLRDDNLFLRQEKASLEGQFKLLERRDRN